MRAVRQFLRTHRVPLIAVVLAAVHSLLFWSLGPRVPLGLFIAAVMVSAWQGGMRPALVATALSVPLLAVIGRYQAPGTADDLALRLAMFVLVGLIAGYLSQQCRLAIRAVEHVHEILGGSGIALISADVAGRVTSLNPLARTLTGLGESDVVGRPLAEVFRAVHGPGRQPVAAPPPGAAQELPEGTLLVRADGAETAVEGSAGPVRDGDGRPAGLMVVFREAGGRGEASQELRRRADRFRALAGYAPAGLMVLDAEGRCVFSNPAAQAACGCTADESLGEGWSRHVRPQDRDRLIGDWLRAVVARQPFADEFQVTAEPGAVRWLRVRSAPMLADNGDVLGHVAALEEITERRRSEEALAYARRESEEQLQEWAAAEQKATDAMRAARADAEEAARKAQGQLDERGTAVRRAEEALRAAHAEAEEKLGQAEAELACVRAELEKASADAADARRRAEDEVSRLRDEVAHLKARPVPAAVDHRPATAAVRDAWREEVEAVVAMHLAARARLAEELAGHHDVHEQLRSSLAAKDGTADSLRDELARVAQEAGAAREAHDRLQALLAERGGSEGALRTELERLGEDAAALRQSHDRLQAVLTEREGTEGSLRQEADRLRAALAERGTSEEALRKEMERVSGEAAELRQAHDRLQAQLAEKGAGEGSLRQELDRLQAAAVEMTKAEEALREELDRLRGEEAGRRRAEEAHERLRGELGERDRREEGLRGELARLRGEQEFLDGVIDGSPAGIFAHDRDGRCRVWNAALERLLGRPRSDALGRTAAELFPPVEARGEPQGEPPAENGAARALPAVGVLGRSEIVESA
ncbi:MAG TPA: PAS domain S-box protein, partial [Gemmataceae bacterium]|nr:PAS domain S-box protein [Gemmataceae bacterium]